MNLGYPQLLICYLLLLGVAGQLSRGRFSPAIAFYFTWCVSLGLLALGTQWDGFKPPALPLPAFNYLAAAGGSFLAGVIGAHLIKRKPPRQKPAGETSAPPARREFYRETPLKLLALVAAVCAAIHFHREIPDLTIFLQTAGTIRDELTDPTRIQASLLPTLATYASIIVIPVAGVYWLRRQRLRWWIVLAAAAAAVLALMTVGKFFFIFVGLVFINSALYSQPPGKRRKKSRAPLLGAGAVIALAFLVVTMLREHRDPLDESTQPGTGMVGTVYVYATGYVPAFGSFYAEYLAGDISTAPTNPDYDPNQRRFGNQTFSGAYRLLAALGIVKSSASNRYDGAFNVYTLHRDLIMDFGTYGSLCFLLLLGFGATLLSRMLDHREPKNLVLLSLLTAQMEFSLIYSLFGFIFYPLALVAAPALVGRTKPLVPTVEKTPGKPAISPS
jgi:oligosaccharide repeat unit polymerase